MARTLGMNDDSRSIITCALRIAADQYERYAVSLFSHRGGSEDISRLANQYRLKRRQALAMADLIDTADDVALIGDTALARQLTAVERFAVPCSTPEVTR